MFVPDGIALNSQVLLINEALSDRALNRKFHQEHEIKNLASALDILNCFEFATKLLSGTIYTTLSVCLPIIYLLEQNLKIDTNDSQFAQTLNKVLQASLQFYCEKYELKSNKQYMTASFLDPRFKKFSQLECNRP
jgi:hypothetical protein